MMKKIIVLSISLFVISACNIAQQKSDPAPQISNSVKETPKVSQASKSCDDYQVEIDKAFVGENLDTISALRKKIKALDCPTDKIETRMSNLAAAKAQKFFKSGNLETAKKILSNSDYTPKDSWLKQAVLGDIAAKKAVLGDIPAKKKLWQKAAFHYNQSLDLIAGLNKNKPPKSEIERVYRLASETQLLAGYITRRSDTMPDGNELGIVIKAYPIPIQFEFNKTVLTSQGKESAEKLVRYLNNKRSHKITVIGHTDPKGSESYNCQLSRGRAMAVKDYLIKAGIRGSKIYTIGKGEREPFDIYDPSVYSQDEINQIHRRVEFSIENDVSRHNAC